MMLQDEIWQGPKARPVIRWTGGKKQLLSELQKYVLPFKRYYEPFVGGGALFFDTAPSLATLGDVNDRLIRTYTAIRDDVDKVIEEIKKHPRSPARYEQLRQCRDIDTRADHEVAAWFIYLNKNSFNGIYRVNRKGEYNVPYDATKKNPLICDEENLRACAGALKMVKLVAGDFEEVVKEAERGDFVYFDPPYIPLTATSSFTAYAKGPFGPEEQTRLRDLARCLHERGVQVLLSNSSSDKVRKLYGEPPFTLIEVSATRSVNSDPTKRGAIKEFIIKCGGS